MQRLARKIEKKIAHRLWNIARRGQHAGEDQRIAHQRVAAMGHMHADLVGPPGGEPASTIRLARGVAERLRRVAVAGQRRLAASRTHGHFLRSRGIAADMALRSRRPAASARPRPGRDRRGRGRARRRRPVRLVVRRWVLAATITPLTCPCRAGGRCPAGARRRCPSGCRRNGRSGR